MENKFRKFCKEKLPGILIMLALLYVFFFAISLLGHSFKGMGREQVSTLLSSATSNPFVGLLIGN